MSTEILFEAAIRQSQGWLNETLSKRQPYETVDNIVIHLFDSLKYIMRRAINHWRTQHCPAALDQLNWNKQSNKLLLGSYRGLAGPLAQHEKRGRPGKGRILWQHPNERLSSPCGRAYTLIFILPLGGKHPRRYIYPLTVSSVTGDVRPLPRWTHLGITLEVYWLYEKMELLATDMESG